MTCVSRIWSDRLFRWLARHDVIVVCFFSPAPTSRFQSSVKPCNFISSSPVDYSLLALGRSTVFFRGSPGPLTTTAPHFTKQEIYLKPLCPLSWHSTPVGPKNTVCASPIGTRNTQSCWHAQYPNRSTSRLSPCGPRFELKLPHAVLVLCADLAIHFAIECVVDCEVQVPVVFRVGLAVDRAGDHLVLCARGKTGKICVCVSSKSSPTKVHIANESI